MCAAAGAEFSADAPLESFNITQPQGNWSAVLDQLRANGALMAEFEEFRYYPFRKTPARLTGRIRFSPTQGLSLEYLTPESRIVIIDDEGGLVIDDRGHRKEMPDDSRAREGMQSLLHIMRFDLEAIGARFSTEGAINESGWRLKFTPIDSEQTGALSPIVLTGTKGLLTRIEMPRKNANALVIEIGETRVRQTFAAEELARFFR